MGLFGKNKKGKHADHSDIMPEDTSGLKNPSFIHTAPYALTADEVLGKTEKPKHKTRDINMSGGVSPLEALKKRVKSNATTDTEEVKEVTKPKTAVPSGGLNTRKVDKDASLLDKCKPFISEDGATVTEKPAYTLESIESIISTSELKAAKLLEQLSNVGSVTFDPLKREEKPVITNTPKVVTENKGVTDADQFATTKIRTISDIDVDQNDGNEDISTTKTITFDSLSATGKFEDITSGTKIIDLSTEMFESEEPKNSSLLVNPFSLENESFAVDDDYKEFSDAKRIGGHLISKVKSARLRAFLSFILLLVIASANLSGIADKLTANPSFFAVISSSVFALLCLINYDVFAALPSLFKKQHVAESTTGVLCVYSLIYAVVSLLSNRNPYTVLLFVSCNIFIKCIAVCLRESTRLKNFRIIASRNKKFALEFIGDRQITFAMAKNSVEGDVLVGVDTPCVNVHDFMKNTEVDRVTNPNFSAFVLIATISCFVMGLFYGISTVSFYDFCLTLTVFSALAFAPTILFTDILPLHSAAKRLTKKGAMITSGTAARKIELANAVTVRSKDIFPAGTITLYNIQALDANRMDETILLAAALTRQIGSPYQSIFEDIAASSGGKIPVADSVKYEERLGISGWVGNRHVFIGNRTLLEAHGIKTPSFEIDKKILQNGYFPVYVASDEKPCALLMVKYNVKTSIAYEMQKLCSSGVTILVDTCDPNITSEMVCDYFGLFDESVYVMGGSGSQLYQNAANEKQDISSYAAHKGSCEAFLSIFNCAAKIKRCISFLRAYHSIAFAVMSAVYIYSSYLNGTSPIESGTVYLYVLISLAVSFIIHLFNKP